MKDKIIFNILSWLYILLYIIPGFWLFGISPDAISVKIGLFYYGLFVRMLQKQWEGAITIELLFITVIIAPFACFYFLTSLMSPFNLLFLALGYCTGVMFEKYKIV